ncbi:MAG TPA: ketopantoate reductase C-terminal domain-containing protein [Pyrinomonadaceae bacterium]
MRSTPCNIIRSFVRKEVPISGSCTEEDYAKNRLAFVDTLPAETTSSMHHDLEQGRRLEIEWLSGGVVDLGRRWVSIRRSTERSATFWRSTLKAGNVLC